MLDFTLKSPPLVTVVNAGTVVNSDSFRDYFFSRDFMTDHECVMSNCHGYFCSVLMDISSSKE